MSKLRINELESLDTGDVFTVSKLATTSRSPYVVGSVAELASVPERLRVDGQAARIAVGGRAGDFTFSTADLSAEVADDPLQGVYVAPDGQDGSAGAWVRRFTGRVFPEWYDVPTDGSVATAAAVQALFSSGLPISGGDGTIKINEHVVITEPKVDFVGAGDSTVFDFSGGGRLTFESALEPMPALAQDVSVGTQRVVFSAAHGLDVNDVFILENQTDFSWSSRRAEYHDGDMMKVFTVVSDTEVIISGTAPDTYAAADMTCLKLTGGKFVFSRCRIIPDALGGRPITVIGKSGVNGEKINVDAGIYALGVFYSRCYDIKTHDISALSRTHPAYPVAFGNCKKIRVTSDSMHSVRHCILLGGNADPGAVPTRDAKIYNCTLENDHDLGIGAADVHGNCDYIEYINCILDSGANPGGRNQAFTRCVIRSRETDGNCSNGTPVGGYLRFTACDFETAQPVGSSSGLIYCSLDHLKQGLQLKITDCTVSGRTDQQIETMIRFNRTTDPDVPGLVEVDVNGLTVNGSSVTIVFDIRDQDISSNCRLSFVNLVGFEGASYLRTTAPSSFRESVPLRTDFCLYERVLEILASESVSHVTTDAIPFKIAFDGTRMPVIEAWFMDQSTGTPVGTAEYQQMVAYVRGHNNQEILGVRVARIDNAAFANDRTVRVFARAGFRDF